MELHPGDLLLYVLQKKPVIKEEDSALKKFGAIIDLLIIYAEDNYCTHSALVSEDCIGVWEATIPNLQYRPLVSAPGFDVYVRRAKNATSKDGMDILSFLPKIYKPEEIEAAKKNGVELQNPSYACAQAALAGLVCLLRMKFFKEDALHESILFFIALLLKPLCSFIDNILINHKNDEKTFFCSQLADYCYSMTSHEKNDKRFELSVHENRILKDCHNLTFLDYLEGEYNKNDKVDLDSDFITSYTSPNNIKSENLFVNDRIIEAGTRLIELMENQKSSGALCARPMILDAKTKNVLPSLLNKLLQGILKLANIEEGTDPYFYLRASFVMPSDLFKETNLEHVGIIEPGNENERKNIGLL